MALKGLTLYDFSDRDLLYALEEAGDNEGWATAREVAKKVGVKHKHPSQCVGSRFAWLRRMDIMDTKLNKDGERLWRLSELGENLLHSKEITAVVSKALDKLSAGQRVKMIETISKDILRDSKSNRGATNLAQRAWKGSMGNWRDPRLARR